MANEFKIKKGLIVDGDSTFSGSLESTQAVTASFFTGSFIGDGTNLTGITAEWDGTHDGDAEITGSLIVSGSGLEVMSTGVTSATFTNNNASTYVFDTNSGEVRFQMTTGYSGNTYGLSTYYGGKMSFNAAGALAFISDGSGNTTFGNSTTLLSARVGIKGSGTTSATDALLVENSSGTELFRVRDDGFIVGTSTVKFGQSLTIERSGPSINFKTTNNAVASGLVFQNSAGSTTARIYHTPDTGKIDFWPSNGGSKMNLTTDGLELTGSLTVTGDTGIGIDSPTARLNIKGSGATSTTTALLVEDSAGTDLLKVEDGGNVGIGTSSPTTKLEVVDSAATPNSPQATFKYNTDYNLSVGYNRVLSNLSGTADFRIGTSTANYMSLVTDNIQRLTIEHTTGDVGIGITSPTARLNVKGSGATSATTALLVENSSGTDLLKITDDGLVTIPSALEHDGDTGTGLHFPSNDTISLKVTNTEALHINSGRNIGIGTTSPSERLHVAGDLKVEGDLHLEGDIDFRVINSSGFGQPGIQLPNFIDTFWRADRRFTLSVTGGQSAAGIAGLFDGTYANLINFAASSTHVITINVASQSGVGSTGYTYPQGYIYFSFYSSTNDYDSISGRIKDKDGNYHSMTGLTDIISNDATYKVMRLTVPSNNYAVEFELTLVTNTNNVRLSAINYVSTRHLAAQMELPYVAKTQDTNRLFGNIDVLTNTGGDQNRISGTGDSYLAVDTGDVGIGLTSPTAKLNVKGSGAASTTTALLVENSSGTDLFKVEDGGNVGIGTTSTTSKLNVDGGISTSGTSGDIDTSRAFALSTLGTFRGGIYSDQTLTGDVGKSLDDVVAYSDNGTFGITVGTVTNKVLTVSGSSVGIGTETPDKELHVVGSAKITGGVTGSSFTGSFVGDGSGLTGIGGGTPGGSATEVQFNDGGAFGGNSNFVFDDSNTRLAIGTTNLNHTLEVNGDFKIGASLIETYTATGLSPGATVVAALNYSSHSRAAIFVDYSVFDATSSSTRAGRVMIASNGTNITSTDNSTADIGNTTGVTWSAAINSGNSTIDITLTVPGTGNWGTTTHITSL